ncbi:MAG TPA: homoserine O-acetyltransferase, partial [bacterium]|nr:homoserine O-acetyltransferase [bacterium]
MDCPLSFTFDGLTLENGAFLGPVTLAYETWGRLNPAGDNAVLVLHALTGDSHAASGGAAGGERGWWEDLIGPGRAIDTGRWFVVCSNVLGGCKGSTGPASLNPATGRAWGLGLPLISVDDMVQAQVRLLDFLGVGRLACAIGGSMGGMQALAWLRRHPERLERAVVLATAARHSPQQIAFQEVGRQAVMADPDWAGGAYQEGAPPAAGLALARMIGHITYMSDRSMARRFGRQRRGHGSAFKFSADFEVEGYLRHRGDSFVKRFDANSYLYLTKAVDDFDATEPPFRPTASGGPRVLVGGFSSDWLYPAYQSRAIAVACRRAGWPTTYTEVESSWGHDAFLLETGRLR